ncbi:hypothetical protein BC829DRAFT_420968 [Chytridium lagenaria]|nr:hypothetical protein BC829DRAFT_420968 [Chytridium lagenaria]
MLSVGSGCSVRQNLMLEFRRNRMDEECFKCFKEVVDEYEERWLHGKLKGIFKRAHGVIVKDGDYEIVDADNKKDKIIRLKLNLSIQYFEAACGETPKKPATTSSSGEMGQEEEQEDDATEEIIQWNTKVRNALSKSNAKKEIDKHERANSQKPSLKEKGNPIKLKERDDGNPREKRQNSGYAEEYCVLFSAIQNQNPKKRKHWKSDFLHYYTMITCNRHELLRRPAEIHFTKSDLDLAIDCIAKKKRAETNNESETDKVVEAEETSFTKKLLKKRRAVIESDSDENIQTPEKNHEDKIG